MQVCASRLYYLMKALRQASYHSVDEDDMPQKAYSHRKLVVHLVGRSELI